jgi:hypothetical protein
VGRQCWKSPYQRFMNSKWVHKENWSKPLLWVEQWVTIEKEQIISHIPYHRRPSGIFGIHWDTFILIESLCRNRF